MKILSAKGYTYKKHLSTGGEGEVHLIMSGDKELVAKIFPKLNQTSYEIISIIQEINISGIPKIYEIFNHDDKTIVIRDYVEGVTLYDEIKKNEYLTLKRAIAIIQNITDTLKQLHNAKPTPIIYRDLKPENVIITPEGDVKLIDFGIARYYKQESLRDTVLAGTKGYTAPEVMAGMQSDVRSDVYSSGLLFYEMLTGMNLLLPPFQIRPVKENNELLPEYLDEIIAKATDFNQTNRYKNIDEFVKAIENKEGTKKQHKVMKYYIWAGIAVFICIFAVGLLFTLKENIKNSYEKDTLSQEVIIPEKETIPILDNEQIVDKSNEDEESYEVLLNLEFDDMNDFEWMYLIRDNVYHDDTEEISFADLTQDGIFNMNYEIGMKYKFSANSFYHMRLRPDDVDEYGVLMLLCFVPEISQEFSEASYEIKLENKQPFSGEIRNDYGYYFEPAKGSPMLVDDYWVDIIVWLDEKGRTFRYLICNAENNSNVVYGGATVFDDWIECEYQIYVDLYFEYWQGQQGQAMPTSEVEFIRQGTGSIERYLEENIEVYESNREKVDEFLEKDIEFIDEDKFTQHGY